MLRQNFTHGSLVANFKFQALVTLLEFAPINSILHGVFNQHILHGGGGKMTPNLTSKPKVMGTPTLACGFVFAKLF